MIYAVVATHHTYQLSNFCHAWGRKLLGRVKFMTYDDLPRRRKFPRGTYLFLDLERLGPEQIAFAAAVAEGLAKAGLRVLNRPGVTLRRYDLLRALHAEGINPFRPWRLDEDLSSVRYPVFLRIEDLHEGSLTGRLENREELDAAIADLDPDPAYRRRVIVVEYEHTADAEGIYRKYAAMKLADRLIPRHVLFSREWVGKFTDLVNEKTVAEENAFHQHNPWEEQIRRVFEIARCDYGRMDFTVVDGQLRVWEINTNPMLGVTPDRADPSRLAAIQATSARITDALESIDVPDSQERIEIQVEPHLRAACIGGASAEAKRTVGKILLRLWHLPPVKAVWRRGVALMHWAEPPTPGPQAGPC